MNSSSIRFLREIADRIPQSELICDSLIFCPTQHIIRGLILEKTGRKAEFYMWSLIAPLFAPVGTTTTLNYSFRISPGYTRDVPVFIDENRSDVLLNEIVALIEREVPRWQRLESTCEFVAEFAGRGDLNRPNVALELGIAECLADNANAGQERLRKILNWPINSPILPQVKSCAINILDALEKGSAAFNAVVESFERENIAKHFPGLSTPIV